MSFTAIEPTGALAKTFAHRAIRARIKAEKSADRHEAVRQQLRAQIFQRFAQRLRGAGSGIWTKE